MSATLPVLYNKGSLGQYMLKARELIPNSELTGKTNSEKYAIIMQKAKELQAANAASATVASTNPAIEKIGGLLKTINGSIKEASDAFNNLTGDGFVYAKQSPLAYLLYTNRELVMKADEEIKKISEFMKNNPSVKLTYKNNAKFPKKSLLDRVRGGKAKTVRNRKAKQAA